MSSPNDYVEVFFANPVDELGNEIAQVTMGNVKTPWGIVLPTKIPHSEMAIDPENTIRADLEDRS